MCYKSSGRKRRVLFRRDVYGYKNLGPWGGWDKWWFLIRDHELRGRTVGTLSFSNRLKEASNLVSISPFPSPTLMWTPCGHLCFYWSDTSCLRGFEPSSSLLFLLRGSFCSACVFFFLIGRALIWTPFSNWEKRLARKLSVSSYSFRFGIEISTMILGVTNVALSRDVIKARSSLNLPFMAANVFILSLGAGSWTTLPYLLGYSFSTHL